VNIQEVWQDITPMARWEWVRWGRPPGFVTGETRRKLVDAGLKVAPAMGPVDHDR